MFGGQQNSGPAEANPPRGVQWTPLRRFRERVLARVSSETKMCQPNIIYKTKKKLREQCFRRRLDTDPRPEHPQTPTPASHLRLSRGELAALLVVPLVAEELGSMPLVDPRLLLGLLMPEQEMKGFKGQRRD